MYTQLAQGTTALGPGFLNCLVILVSASTLYYVYVLVDMNVRMYIGKHKYMPCILSYSHQGIILQTCKIRNMCVYMRTYV